MIGLMTHAMYIHSHVVGSGNYLNLRKNYVINCLWYISSSVTSILHWIQIIWFMLDERRIQPPLIKTRRHKHKWHHEPLKQKAWTLFISKIQNTCIHVLVRMSVWDSIFNNISIWKKKQPTCSYGKFGKKVRLFVTCINVLVLYTSFITSIRHQDDLHVYTQYDMCMYM